ncbi:MAG TPA: hypothetical protein VFR78_09590 [Pyrinomonadaceae bacterium]|nr:hypothetical protein [Pyrinomonadaceae bacterium]
MSTIYYCVLKKFFRAIAEHRRRFRALQRLTKMKLDHVDHVDRTHDENDERLLGELKI